MQNDSYKIESGIEGFDKLTFGGFPAGRSYLIAGEPGTGKTIFSLQYLLAGLEKGEKAIFITIDEKPEHILADAKALGWDFKPYLENGLFQIIDATSYFSAIYDGEGQRIDVKQIVNDLLGHVKASGAKRMVIDPIAPLIFSEKDFPNVIEFIRTLVFAIESNSNCTTLLTSYIPVGSNKVSCFGIEEFATSGIIVLRLVTLNNKRIRTISIRKMRGTRIDLSEYSFELLPGRGVTLRQPV
jgi:circadian clock protein KaiC